MPPKLCGRCNKTVYPTEELKCLDKSWHKGCFKCQVCNMTLNMKNYKGYDKLPYCNAHYPQIKHTAVAETPENRRIAENTKIQSNIHYHADFERQKGTKITVADDPETMRARQNMEVISNIAYHGEKDRKQQMEFARPAEQVEAGQRRMNPGSISSYDPLEHQAPQQPVGAGGTPYSNRNSAGARQVYDSNIGRGGLRGRQSSRWGEEPAAVAQPQSHRYSGTGESVGRFEQPAQRKVGSIHDYDPMNEKYGSVAGQYGSENRRAQPAQQPYQPPQQSYQPPPQQQYQPPAPAQQPYQPPAPAPAGGQSQAGKGMVCQAMYDYDAADSDEVSFREGDMIIFCQPIDAGWMEGTVEKSGQRGMLPSNYVEKVN